MAGAQESCFPCFTPVPMTFSEARKYVSYLHERLDLSSNSIRLVRILPELSPMGQIQCRIWHDTTESEYRCLSYMWGSPEEYFIISLNGRGFAIRANLNFFLDAVRTLHMEEVFWIDALCIDQNTVLEKNHQVQHMGEIYLRASTVIVWLGPRNEEKHLAFRFLSQEGPYTPTSLIGGHDNQSFDQAGQDVWDAVVALCEDEYWGRAWVLQEVLLARSLMLMCGERAMPWNDFSDPLLLITDPVPEDRATPLSRLRKSRARTLCRQRIKNSGNMHRYDLNSLLKNLGMSNCSDIRDRIFGLLSLTNVTLQVDYTMTPEDLFKRLIGICYPSAESRVDESILHHYYRADHELYLDILGINISEKMRRNLDMALRVSGRVHALRIRFTELALTEVQENETRYGACKHVNEKLDYLMVSRNRNKVLDHDNLLHQPRNEGVANKCHAEETQDCHEIEPYLIKYTTMMEKNHRIGRSWRAALNSNDSILIGRQGFATLERSLLERLSGTSSVSWGSEMRLPFTKEDFDAFLSASIAAKSDAADLRGRDNVPQDIFSMHEWWLALAEDAKNRGFLDARKFWTPARIMAVFEPQSYSEYQVAEVVLVD